MTSDKKLSIPLGAWTPADEADAMKEGWLLAAFNQDNDLRVVKFDESDIFESDREASDYVRLINTPLHNKARAAMGHPQIPLDEDSSTNCGDQLDITVSHTAYQTLKEQTLKEQTLKEQILNANDDLDRLIKKAMPLSDTVTLEDQANTKALIIAMQSDQYKDLLNPSFTSLPELIYTSHYYITCVREFQTMNTFTACARTLEDLACSIYTLNSDLDNLSFINVHQQDKQKAFEESLAAFLHLALVLGVLSNTNPLKRMYEIASDRTLQWVRDQNVIHNLHPDHQYTPKPAIRKSII